MQKKWLIDAHNVMHKIPDLPRQLKINACAAITTFCDLVQQKCVQNGVKARLVFDGMPQLMPAKYSYLDLLFSRERTADEVIISMLKKPEASNYWILVSDDREIRHRAFYHRVEILRTDDFLKVSSPKKQQEMKSATVVSDPGKASNPIISDSEVSELLKLMTGKK